MSKKSKKQLAELALEAGDEVAHGSDYEYVQESLFEACRKELGKSLKETEIDEDLLRSLEIVCGAKAAMEMFGDPAEGRGISEIVKAAERGRILEVG